MALTLGVAALTLETNIAINMATIAQVRTDVIGAPSVVEEIF